MSPLQIYILVMSPFIQFCKASPNILSRSSVISTGRCFMSVSILLCSWVNPSDLYSVFDMETLYSFVWKHHIVNFLAAPFRSIFAPPLPIFLQCLGQSELILKTMFFGYSNFVQC